MCGIPMTPPSDAATGKKLTFEQALAHIGGRENLISDQGMALARGAAHDYIWKYPDGSAFCTACGGRPDGLKRRHGAVEPCPICGKKVEFRHEARGHKSEYDEFYVYEWRRSAIDPQAITLTATDVWRDSRHAAPEAEPLRIEPQSLYIFRPGHAVTTYRRWYLNEQRWHSVDSIAPAHTGGYGGNTLKFVMDWGEFRLALEGTRIGETFALLAAHSNRRDELELPAIANCARRPWLEYLAKAGQPALAAELMRMDRVPRDVVPRQRARAPRELLGLTEGQWYEIRRDRIPLTCEALKVLGKLRRCGLEDVKIAEAVRLSRDVMSAWRLDTLAPSRVRREYHTPTACDIMEDAGVPEKLRRKACRRIAADLEHAQEWRDYYQAVVGAGEDLRDTRFLLPRDMHAMHDEMTRRERLMMEEIRARADARKAEKLAQMQAAFLPRLEKLRRKYCFSACGLILRPYESAGEVLAEGRALDICIGGYAEGYMQGRNIICCLRRAEEPDEPWRAVEFSTKDGRMVQDRGYKNDRTTNGGYRSTIGPGTRAQLRLFWAAWERHRQATGGKTA